MILFLFLSDLFRLGQFYCKTLWYTFCFIQRRLFWCDRTWPYRSKVWAFSLIQLVLFQGLIHQKSRLRNSILFRSSWGVRTTGMWPPRKSADSCRGGGGEFIKNAGHTISLWSVPNYFHLKGLCHDREILHFSCWYAALDLNNVSPHLSVQCIL